MNRKNFIGMWVMSGLAGSIGLAGGAELAHAGLLEAMRAAGLGACTVSEMGGTLRARGRVVDYAALATHGGRLGEGKVVANGAILSFEPNGRRVNLELMT